MNVRIKGFLSMNPVAVAGFPPRWFHAYYGEVHRKKVMKTPKLKRKKINFTKRFLCSLEVILTYERVNAPILEMETHLLIKLSTFIYRKNQCGSFALTSWKCTLIHISSFFFGNSLDIKMEPLLLSVALMLWLVGCFDTSTTTQDVQGKTSLCDPTLSLAIKSSL